MSKYHPYVSPDGRQFRTLEELCDAYGVCQNTIRYRMNHGKTLEEALNQVKYLRTNLRKQCRPANGVYDHAGNHYDNMPQMLTAYNVSRGAFYYRRKKKHTLQECLEGYKHTRTRCRTRCIRSEDHLGNVFESVKEMCEHYGITPTTYCKRIERGYTVEQALTKPVKSRGNKD